ncbi:alpha-amylase family glycosyl hydrolase [Roseimaritima ulvae]|uniref:Malto-oligosyltrehalose trehalohydrolase n=1 Tax=Roseimaritima ulvae TaxID=980254 RepID=A0A5B9QUE9_9BACT|nr:alpha-amylase family glycosyl hydrolase [Roseimaritima ulvae]QEG41390.1 Malto-oligosyltrehalose trehalohydrolase [Roseimaritima ulvae]
MIDLQEVGAHVSHDGNQWLVRIGIYLPGIRYADGYRVRVRVIHRRDQFVAAIKPLDFDLFCHDDHDLDLWDTTVNVTANRGIGSFGDEGIYHYRFQLLRGQDVIVEWFSDPFARRSAPGTHAAFVLDSGAASFAWSDDAWRTPEVDDLVVYELHIDEFNRTFDGVVDRLDYLLGLGVNVLELMPVSNVKEDIEWGYTPLGYFAPDERYGGPEGMKRMVDACHAKGIAVIVDAVYAHAHAEFPYSLLYDRVGEPNSMMGVYQGEFFSRPGTDYAKEFTREFFWEVNRYWIDEYHIDGFRYDYVPGMYEGPTGRGYSRLVHRTYNYAKSVSRFSVGDGTDRTRIIQCAEHLPDPQGVLRNTYTNCCWQNALLDKAADMGRHGYVDDQFVHLLDPSYIGYPEAYRHPTSGESFPVAPFQYIETHDHGRFLARVAPTGEQDVLQQPFGDRGQFYIVQPFIIAMYTAKGIPMLWQGQEFAENWGVPHHGFGRILFRRDVHWEHFYDREGRALLRLHRRLGELRRSSPALRSRGYFYYYFDPQQLQRGVVCYRREATNGSGETLLVFLNFSSTDQQGWAPFPHAGTWTELLDADSPGGADSVTVDEPEQWHAVSLPAHYGAIYRISI